MKYLLTNDFYNIFVNKRKLIYLWLLILILYPIFIRIVLDINFTDLDEIDLFLGNIGGNYNVNSVFEYLILLWNVTFYSYIVIDVFTKDVKYGRENIFLRVSKEKWLTRKIIIIITYTTILEIFSFLILGLVYILLGANFDISTIFSIIVIDILIKLFLQFINIFLLLFSSKYSFFIIIFIYTIPFAFANFFNDYINQFTQIYFTSSYMKNSMLILVTIIIGTLALIIANKLLLEKFFERCEN